MHRLYVDQSIEEVAVVFIKIRALRRLALFVAVVAVAGSALPGYADTRASTSVVDIKWSHALGTSPKYVPSDAALGPASGSVGLYQRRNQRHTELVIKRWSEGGRVLWSRHWDGPQGVGQVMPQLVSVSKPTGAIFVAGNGVCRLGASQSGPLFVRRYSKSGAVKWTRWAGRCPGKHGGSLPRASEVSGLDVRGHRIAVAANFGRSASDGFVRLYSTSGQFRWQRNVEFKRYPATSDRTLDVALDRTSVYVVGVVEAERRSASEDIIDTEAFVAALHRKAGRLQWRRVASDQGRADYDANTAVSFASDTLYIGGMRNATAGSGDPGTAVVERWALRGRPIWRRTLPTTSTIEDVVGLPDRSVVAAANAGSEVGLDMVIRRITHHGDRQWSYRWDRGDKSAFLSGFDANQSAGAGMGGTTPSFETPVATRAWRWKW